MQLLPVAQVKVRRALARSHWHRRWGLDFQVLMEMTDCCYRLALQGCLGWAGRQQQETRIEKRWHWQRQWCQGWGLWRRLAQGWWWLRGRPHLLQ